MFHEDLYSRPLSAFFAAPTFSFHLLQTPSWVNSWQLTKSTLQILKRGDILSFLVNWWTSTNFKTFVLLKAVTWATDVTSGFLRLASGFRFQKPFNWSYPAILLSWQNLWRILFLPSDRRAALPCYMSFQTIDNLGVSDDTQALFLVQRRMLRGSVLSPCWLQ